MPKSKVIYRQSVITDDEPIDVTLWVDGKVSIAQANGEDGQDIISLPVDQCRRLGGILSRCQELAKTRCQELAKAHAQKGGS